MNIDKLKGLAVVSLTEGTKLGTVTAPLFDPATLALRAYRVKGGGQTFLVPLEQVDSIGADALMVENSRVTRATTEGGEFGDLAEFATLKRLQVVDAAGNLLGTLHDLEPEPTTGAPLRLTIRKGGFMRFGGETTTIEAASIRSVGSDFITVAEVAVLALAGTEAAPGTVSL